MKNTKLFMFAACTLFLAACGKQTVKIMTPPDASNRVLFSAEQLQTTLDKAGYQVMMQQGDTTFSDPEIKTILLTEVNDTTLKKEGFHITTTGNLTRVSGRDGSGVIYGCRELIDRVNDSEGKLNFPEELKDGPEMVLRGACVGVAGVVSWSGVSSFRQLTAYRPPSVAMKDGASLSSSACLPGICSAVFCRPDASTTALTDSGCYCRVGLVRGG